MSVTVEFVLPSSEFLLGPAPGPAAEAAVSFERYVPVAGEPPAHAVATGSPSTLESFESHLAASGRVAAFDRLARRDGSALYRLELAEPAGDPLLGGIAREDGALLAVDGDDGWRFRVRFPDREALGAFYEHCRGEGVPVSPEYVYGPAETLAEERPYGLTAGQHEALLLALRRGYFDTPGQVTLQELADEVGVSQQALSKRIRRANEKVLRGTLLRSDR